MKNEKKFRNEMSKCLATTKCKNSYKNMTFQLLKKDDEILLVLFSIIFVKTMPKIKQKSPQLMLLICCTVFEMEITLLNLDFSRKLTMCGLCKDMPKGSQ